MTRAHVGKPVNGSSSGLLLAGEARPVRALFTCSASSFWSSGFVTCGFDVEDGADPGAGGGAITGAVAVVAAGPVPGSVVVGVVVAVVVVAVVVV